MRCLQTLRCTGRGIGGKINNQKIHLINPAKLPGFLFLSAFHFPKYNHHFTAFTALETVQRKKEQKKLCKCAVGLVTY
jgi:hypothetical protein